MKSSPPYEGRVAAASADARGSRVQDRAGDLNSDKLARSYIRFYFIYNNLPKLSFAVCRKFD
jgi:hypothetical protein